jgi:hypothetical protein
VVGGFDQDDINVKELGPQIKFYGYRRPDFLANFYAGMDIFLSPNRPAKLYKGNFDGFPLGIDAGFCGVAQLVADELNMNTHYVDGREIEIIPLSVEKITARVMYYYRHPDWLYKLAAAGQAKTQQLFDIDYQIDERLKVFEKFVNLTKVELSNK